MKTIKFYIDKFRLTIYVYKLYHWNWRIWKIPEAVKLAEALVKLRLELGHDEFEDLVTRFKGYALNGRA